MMHYMFCFFYLVCSTVVECKHLAPCPDKKNYYGQLTTLRDRVYEISEVSVAHKQHCIPAYKAPKNAHTIITHLTYDPQKCIDRLNLSDIAAIEVPYPYATWVYKAPGCGKKKYVLITVIWNNEDRSREHYLIEPKRRLNVRIKKKSREVECQIPFKGFKKITLQAAE